MNWFKGEIVEAVNTSKAKQAIFVVYVYGNDEKSTQMTQVIDEPQVAKTLGSDRFVAIKIEANSVPYQQFSEIYKQVPVPSIYFIGKKGVPLEIYTELSHIENFQEKVNIILQKEGLPSVVSQTQDFINNEQTDAPTASQPKNVVCDNGVCTIKKDDQPSTSQVNKPEESTPEKSEVEEIKPSETKSEEPKLAEKELTVEDKVERAKQLVEKKREENRKEELEQERQQEIERRKMGQSVQQLKRWQEDQELKQVLEEREKEKRAAAEARQRVLAQIAQDKAERAAKFSSGASTSSSSPTQQQPTASPQISPKPANTNTARLQFRMPDGRTATNDFPSSETLDSVHKYIKANLNLPFSSYTLSTTFPKREFTDNDKSQSLLDLGLVPTAVILILPISRGTVSSNTPGGLKGLLWSLFTPIFTILGYLKTFIFGSGPAANPNSNGQNKRAAEGASDTRAPPKIRRAGETTVIKRQGNVHRLSNKNDSDDENNTWNGNSTQQM